MTPSSFLDEANACLKGVDGVSTDASLADQLLALANDTRSAQGQSGVEALDSLSEAARLHAYDMAVRHYAAHDDLEGRSHLDRVRMVERSHLIGAFGANVVVVRAGLPAEEIQKAILADVANASNFKRTEFDHMGIAAVEANGMLYIVELFARIDGTLDTPLPPVATPRTDIAANFSEKLEPVGWSVVSPSGETLMRGIGRKLPANLPTIEEGYLQVDVALGTDVYTLKGPALSSSL